MRCRYCGKKISGERRVYCNDGCRNAFHLQSKSLSDWCREAAECNLSYGTYRALRNMGKSFDELKARADTNRVVTHAHGNANLPVSKRF